jgi:predicted small secreted protein
VRARAPVRTLPIFGVRRAPQRPLTKRKGKWTRAIETKPVRSIAPILHQHRASAKPVQTPRNPRRLSLDCSLDPGSVLFRFAALIMLDFLPDMARRRPRSRSSLSSVHLLQLVVCAALLVACKTVAGIEEDASRNEQKRSLLSAQGRGVRGAAGTGAAGSTHHERALQSSWSGTVPSVPTITADPNAASASTGTSTASMSGGDAYGGFGDDDVLYGDDDTYHEDDQTQNQPYTSSAGSGQVLPQQQQVLPYATGKGNGSPPSSGKGSYPVMPPSGKGSYPVPPPSGKGSYPVLPPSGKGSYPVPPPSGKGSYPVPPPSGKGSYPVLPPSGKGSYPVPPPSGKGSVIPPPPSGQGKGSVLPQYDDYYYSGAFPRARAATGGLVGRCARPSLTVTFVRLSMFSSLY